MTMLSDFTPGGTIQADNHARMELASVGAHKNTLYLASRSEAGAILLTAVPDDEVGLWTDPATREVVTQGLNEARAGLSAPLSWDLDDDDE